MLSFVGSEVIRILCFLQIGIIIHQAWNQIKKKANEGKKIQKIFDDPESRDYVVCEVLHSIVCFVVTVQSSPQRVSRYLFHRVFFIFSILCPYFLQSFTTKEKQILIIFFHFRGHDITWYFFLYLNLFMSFFWSISHISICILKYVWHLWLLFGLFTILV